MLYKSREKEKCDIFKSMHFSIFINEFNMNTKASRKTNFIMCIT